MGLNAQDCWAEMLERQAPWADFGAKFGSPHLAISRPDRCRPVLRSDQCCVSPPYLRRARCCPRSFSPSLLLSSPQLEPLDMRRERLAESSVRPLLSV